MDTPKVGRLAMRVEGDYWNAYYAMPDTMKGAIHLGSIKMVFVRDNDQHKHLFLNLMQDAVADIVEDAAGQRPTWDKPMQGPESERSGSA